MRFKFIFYITLFCTPIFLFNRKLNVFSNNLNYNWLMIWLIRLVVFVSQASSDNEPKILQHVKFRFKFSCRIRFAKRNPFKNLHFQQSYAFKTSYFRVSFAVSKFFEKHDSLAIFWTNLISKKKHNMSPCGKLFARPYYLILTFRIISDFEIKTSEIVSFWKYIFRSLSVFLPFFKTGYSSTIC